jgi:transglutaminase-like putative cysteine protease
VVSLATELRKGNRADAAFACAAFEWVRDRVAHSVDAGDARVTVSATEVLEERVGLCFAKSHLLVALLRAGGIPAGLCYQRLADGDRHIVHGLVALHLDGSWHRQDPRGNNGSVRAEFSLDGERLAWRVEPSRGECDYLKVREACAPEVVSSLRGADDALRLCREGLPSRLD